MNLWKQITNGPAAPFARPMREALDDMEGILLNISRSAGELREGIERIAAAGGKRLRPLLAWSCWSLAGGQGKIVPLMAMLELMHTVSLIHDDFVDGAATRRGVATINATDGGRSALRSGDYLLSRAMEFLKIYRGTGINEALSTLSQEMCLGELEQRSGLFRAEGMTEERYFSRIRKKTALFLAECCRCGAVAGGAGFDDRLTKALYSYGLHLGMAFQLRDDLLDWEPSAGGKTGKAPLQDLSSGVITLPAIYAVAEDDISLCAMLEKRDKTPKELREILRLVQASGALEQTQDVLRRESEDAIHALSVLPAGAEKRALTLLADAVSGAKATGTDSL